MKFIRPKDVLDLVGISRSTLWRLCRAGRFPRPVRITAGRSAFVYEAVRAWMECRLRGIPFVDDPTAYLESQSVGDDVRGDLGLSPDVFGALAEDGPAYEQQPYA